MLDLNLVKRIVDLRQSGLRWGQVEEIVFPGSDPKKGAPKCGPLCKKAGEVGTGAFEKHVFGAFTHTQVVEKIRPKMMPMQPQVVEMFI